MSAGMRVEAGHTGNKSMEVHTSDWTIESNVRCTSFAMPFASPHTYTYAPSDINLHKSLACNKINHRQLGCKVHFELEIIVLIDDYNKIQSEHSLHRLKHVQYEPRSHFCTTSIYASKIQSKNSSHLFKHLILNVLLCGTFPGEGHDQLNDPFIDKILQLLLIYEILQYKDFTLDENTDLDTTCLAVACKD
jgi:hypothetical protein